MVFKTNRVNKTNRANRANSAKRIYGNHSIQQHLQGREHLKVPLLLSLPLEMQCMVLSSADLDEAYATSRTCTNLKVAFEFCKKDLLSRALEGVEADAMAYCLSGPAALQSPLSNRQIQLFLKRYHHSLESGRPLRVEKENADECIDWLIQVHAKGVLRLMRDFETWSMGSTKPYHHIGPAVNHKLSATEKVRILKAIYRNGIFVNLFGRPSQSREGIFNPAQVRRLFLQPLPRCEAEAVASVGAFIYHRGHRYSFQSLLQGCPAVNDSRTIEAVMSLELSFPIVEDFSPEELGRNEENSGDDTDITDADGDSDGGGNGDNEGDDDDSGDKGDNGDGNGNGNGNGNDGDGDSNDGDDAGDGAGDNEGDKSDEGDDEDDMINPYDMPDYDDTVEEVNWSDQADAQNNENVQHLVRWARPLKTVSTEPMLRNYFSLKDTMRSNDARHRFRILGLARPYGFSVWDDDRYEGGLNMLFDYIVDVAKAQAVLEATWGNWYGNYMP